jgi:UDP-glucuronate decarboxylase
LYVDDLVEGLQRLMDSPPRFTGPVKGNPAEFTIRELAELVLLETRSSSPIITRPLPQDDPKQRQPDTSVAKTRLDSSPRVPSREGLKPTIEYFRAHID